MQSRVERREVLVPRETSPLHTPATTWVVRVFYFLLMTALAGCGAGADSGEPPGTSGEAASTPPPTDANDNAGVEATPEDGLWLTGSTRIDREVTGIVTVTDIRAARHDTFDRFVITFDGDSLPTLEAGLSAGPALHCGSGEPVELSGEAVLTVGLNPARAHDDSGNITLAPRDTAPGLPTLLEARLICDFEGHVAWAFGIAHAREFRVMELTQPARIAVDIRH